MHGLLNSFISSCFFLLILSWDRSSSGASCCFTELSLGKTGFQCQIQAQCRDIKLSTENGKIKADLLYETAEKFREEENYSLAFSHYQQALQRVHPTFAMSISA